MNWKHLAFGTVIVVFVWPIMFVLVCLAFLKLLFSA